jgi:hypothetical protein
MRKPILITGASSGIGYFCAKELSKNNNYQVFATVRNEKDFKRLSQEGLNVLYLDLNTTKSIKKCAKEFLRKTDGKIYAIFNNAGYGQPGAVEDIDDKTLKHLTKISKHTAGIKKAHKKGAISEGIFLFDYTPLKLTISLVNKISPVESDIANKIFILGVPDFFPESLKEVDPVLSYLLGLYLLGNRDTPLRNLKTEDWSNNIFNSNTNLAFIALSYSLLTTPQLDRSLSKLDKKAKAYLVKSAIIRDK